MMFRFHRHNLRVLVRRPCRPSTRPFSSSSPTPVCPSCAAPLPTTLPACPKCFHIERPTQNKKYDYYELLETPKSPNPFIVDESRLKNNFRRMQRYVHPDLWASQGEVKTQAAHDLSGLVNEAYSTLLQPLSRIHYILSQHNLNAAETDQLNDPHLITEVIEIREALDDASSESEVEGIKNDVAGRISTTVKNIERAVHLENWEEAHREAVRLKYLRGIEAAAEHWTNAPSSAGAH
ncbi:hypothetical protein B0F90DRAFT_1680936 [Multifurca ochricompacta]|uniref:J domain-containing protein n=1 Tax=Multifurca ochricompacta TaxID=376703 RepID=A0AAD4MDU5_9AGAM|nr:hypothetical protein B0F90DRAFT_1680936 [Multifurca ochricompacta]